MDIMGFIKTLFSLEFWVILRTFLENSSIFQVFEPSNQNWSLYLSFSCAINLILALNSEKVNFVTKYNEKRLCYMHLAKKACPAAALPLKDFVPVVLWIWNLWHACLFILLDLLGSGFLFVKERIGLRFCNSPLHLRVCRPIPKQLPFFLILKLEENAVLLALIGHCIELHQAFSDEIHSTPIY